MVDLVAELGYAQMSGIRSCKPRLLGRCFSCFVFVLMPMPCGGDHLHSWMSYVQRFIGYYMKKLGPGFRHMTPSEAEEVDKEVLNEVFRLVYHDGNTLDAAREALVREDLLRIKMVSAPKLAKQPAPTM